MIQELLGQEKQIKMCRKLQHVKRYMERNMSKIIRCLTAVGRNYNSTRDNFTNENEVIRIISIIGLSILIAMICVKISEKCKKNGV